MATRTSIEAYKGVAKDEWYGRILAIMREAPDLPFCIADLAHAMNAEKSTISARLNEMRKLGMIEETAKARSRTTGILSQHYKLKLQDSLW